MKHISCPICNKQFEAKVRVSSLLKDHVKREHGVTDFINFFRTVYFPSIGIETGYCKQCRKETRYVSISKRFSGCCSGSYASLYFTSHFSKEKIESIVKRERKLVYQDMVLIHQ